MVWFEGRLVVYGRYMGQNQFSGELHIFDLDKGEENSSQLKTIMQLGSRNPFNSGFSVPSFIVGGPTTSRLWAQISKSLLPEAVCCNIQLVISYSNYSPIGNRCVAICLKKQKLMYKVLAPSIITHI